MARKSRQNKKTATINKSRRKVASKKLSAKTHAGRRRKRALPKSYGFEPREIAGRFDSHEEHGGQSGDTQGLSKSDRVDFESVEELAQEGQAFEAEIVEGVEDAPDADVSEVYTHEVSEDDIPPEYGGSE